METLARQKDAKSPDMTIGKKTAGIILAAGASSRMGRTKQLLPFKNTTLLGRVMENAARSRLHERIVVLGHDADHIIKALDFSGTRIVRNPDYALGQSTSLIKGLSAVSREIAGAMFLLADQPLVGPMLIDRILSAFEVSDAPIIIPFFQGRRGNPVIVDRSLFPRLSLLTRDTGARDLFREYESAIVKVPVDDPAVVTDIDTPDDYREISESSGFPCPNENQ